MSGFIKTANNGQLLVSTNYWETQQAKAGLCYLTWNAGAARLLVPTPSKAIIKETEGARMVVVSRGSWPEQGNQEGLELLWEDDSNNPFCLLLSLAQTDRLFKQSDSKTPFVVTIWTEEGMQAEWEARSRVVSQIPCAQPWDDSAL